MTVETLQRDRGLVKHRADCHNHLHAYSLRIAIDLRAVPDQPEEA